MIFECAVEDVVYEHLDDRAKSTHGLGKGVRAGNVNWRIWF